MGNHSSLFRRHVWGPLLAAVLSYAMTGSAGTTVLPFTPYHCQLAAFDTTVHCSDGDTLLMVNAAPSPFAGNYFLELNGTIIDTISSVPGDTMWRKAVSTGDSVLSILVWSMPGSCYGQRYTLLRSVGQEEADLRPLLVQRGNELYVTCRSPKNRLRVFSLAGDLMADFPTVVAGTTTWMIAAGPRQAVLVILESEKRTWSWKLMMP